MTTMKVRDLMTEDVQTIGASDSLATVYDKMDRQHIRHLPVVDEQQRVVGIISSRDLMKAAASGTENLPMSAQRQYLMSIKVADTMNAKPETTEPSTELRDAAEVMLEHKLGCLPVTEDGRLVGIITEADFVRHVLETV